MFLMPKPTMLHIGKLALRGAMLLAAAAALAYRRIQPAFNPAPLFALIWLAFMAEMVRRLFPIRSESIGCQKQYAYTFRPCGDGGRPHLAHRRALAVAAIWAAVNALLGFASAQGMIGAEGLVLFSLFFAVCDMVCVLVFCPFQKWVMKNRCCITCRIYDWDYAMMFAPLIFVPSLAARGLFAMGLVVLVKWEISVFRHPERFSDAANSALSCKNCTEKLCRHKKL